MAYTQVTPPAVEPISLDEAKLHLRVDLDYEDQLIGALITAARQQAEQITARSLITQVWRYTADAFPGAATLGSPLCGEFSLPDNAILLEKTPLQAVTSIQYTDMGGNLQTVPAGTYIVDASGPLARITPRFGQIWPIALPQIGSVQVNYRAGYGDTADAVPQTVKAWIKLALGHLYVTRSLTTDVPTFLSKMAETLLDTQRIWRV